MTPYEQLRRAVVEELAEPGAVTRAEVEAVLERFPEQHPDDHPQAAAPGILRLG